MLVARIYPWRAIFAVQCDVKGNDTYAVTRLAVFLRHCGVVRCCCMCDQESAIGSMMEAALKICGSSGKWAGGVPETSAAGERQSNSRAERAAQELEDHLRTIQAVLEARLGRRIPSTHPNVRWMLEHSATTLNKYAVHDNGEKLATAYELLHGKQADEKLAEFGERVLFWIPKARKGKLDLRWSCGVFLGTCMHSNEADIALPNGDVVRPRGICRIRPDQRWRPNAVQAVLGVPSSSPCPTETTQKLRPSPNRMYRSMKSSDGNLTGKSSNP